MKPIQHTTEDLNRLSFHAFKFQDDYLLFDRATETTSTLNEFTYEFFRLVELGASFIDAHREIEAKHGTVNFDHLVEAVEALRDNGFFEYEDVNKVRQAELMEELWNHKPRRIQLLMAQGCNLGCRYCYAWRNGSNQKHTLMPWNVAKTSVDYLVWRSGTRSDIQITFFGGEPLLNYEMIKRIVAYCKEIERLGTKVFTFELITNGTLLDKDVVEFCVEHKFLLFISIDGWKEMHDYNRPAMDRDDACYETIIKNATYANRRYIEMGLHPIKARANLTKQFPDMWKVGAYLASLGFKTVGVGAIEPLPHGFASPSAMTDDQLDALHEETTDVFIDALEQTKSNLPLDPFVAKKFSQVMSKMAKRELKGITCGIGRNTQIVDNKGNIFPCHRYEGMDNFIIGDVFSGLDRGKTMGYYFAVNSHAVEKCSKCWIRDYCAGGCVWLLSDKDGKIHDPSQRECDRRRGSVERALWLRKELRASNPENFKNEEEVNIEDWNWAVPIEQQDYSDAELVKLASGCGSCKTCGSTEGCSS